MREIRARVTAARMGESGEIIADPRRERSEELPHTPCIGAPRAD
jgi:hypothetical protein